MDRFRILINSGRTNVASISVLGESLDSVSFESCSFFIDGSSDCIEKQCKIEGLKCDKDARRRFELVCAWFT